MSAEKEALNQVQYHATGETVAIYVYVNGERQKFVKDSYYREKVVEAVGSMETWSDSNEGLIFNPEGAWIYRPALLDRIKEVEV